MKVQTPAVAGYKMLMILAKSDGYLAPKEKRIIKQYIHEKFLHQIQDDLNELSADGADDEDVFLKEAMSFHQSTGVKEEMEFLHFAFDLVKADLKITKEENSYINMLYDVWQLDNRE